MLPNGDPEGRISEDRRLASRGEACLVLPNGDPEGRIFLSYPHMNNGLFFLLTTVFIYLFIYLFIYFKISFQKSMNTLRCNFTG